MPTCIFIEADWIKEWKDSGKKVYCCLSGSLSCYLNSEVSWLLITETKIISHVCFVVVDVFGINIPVHM